MSVDPFLEHKILAADPIELIQILHEHAIRFVGEARTALAAGDIVSRSQAISRTIGLLGELEGSLNKDAGGAVSQNLAALYQYMRSQLTVANLKQEDGPLAEVESLMQTLAGAWHAIHPNAMTGPGGEAAPQSTGLPTPGEAQFLPDVNPVYAEHSWSA